MSRLHTGHQSNKPTVVVYWVNTYSGKVDPLNPLWGTGLLTKPELVEKGTHLSFPGKLRGSTNITTGRRSHVLLQCLEVTQFIVVQFPTSQSKEPHIKPHLIPSPPKPAKQTTQQTHPPATQQIHWEPLPKRQDLVLSLQPRELPQADSTENATSMERCVLGAALGPLVVYPNIQTYHGHGTQNFRNLTHELSHLEVILNPLPVTGVKCVMFLTGLSGVDEHC